MTEELSAFLIYSFPFSNYYLLGGYPISSYHIRYRLKNETDEDWISCQPDLISPTQVN